MRNAFFTYLALGLAWLPVSCMGEEPQKAADPAKAFLDIKEGRVSVSERRIELACEFVIQDGFLEYALVTPTGPMHETLLAWSGDPSELAKALSDIGLTDEKKAAAEKKTAGRVRLEIAWEADGKKNRAPLESFILSDTLKTPMSASDWIVSGSRWWTDKKTNEKFFLAKEAGTLIAFYKDTDALLNNPNRYTADESGKPSGGRIEGNPDDYRVNTKTALKRGAKVTLIITPSPEKPTAGAPAK